jgi:serine/threonine protein kinase
VVGSWRVRSRRSHGSYGTVYLASPAAQLDAAPFALKVALHPNDPRFLREAELLRRIVHPHVPGLHDHGLWTHPAGPFPFLVMDWVEGVPLQKWAHERTLTSLQVLRLLAPVAGALAATHAAQGVHRDVKGDNILVRQDDAWPTLLDFGAGDFLGAPTLTHELLPPGTPQHRSPEALRFYWLHRHLPTAHYEPGPADDVYALGVTAYCLVTGIYPQPVLPPELLDSEPAFRPPVWKPPEQLVTVCPELAALIRQMLALEPSARGSAAQLTQAMEQAGRTAGPHAEQPIVPRSSNRGSVAHRAAARVQAALVAGAQVHEPPSQSSVALPAARKRQPDVIESARVLWPWSAVAALVVLLALQGGGSQRSPEKPAAGAMANHRRDTSSEDASAAGLGNAALSACGGSEEPAPSEKQISVTVPKTPLPGQARPPCKRREVEINGGCWKRPEDPTPPCAEREYEWRGLCYAPVLDPSPPATSEQR